TALTALLVCAVLVLASALLFASPFARAGYPNSAHASYVLVIHSEGTLERGAPQAVGTVTCCTWVTNITGFQTPQQMLYDPANGEIWVSNGNYNGENIFGNESVISDTTNTVTATIPVQIGPVGIAYDSSNSEMYVANEGGTNLANLQGSVSVISTATNHVVDTFNNSVGTNPEGVLYDSAKGEIFVANSIDYTGSGPSNISIYSDATNSFLGSSLVGINPIDMAYDSAKGEIFVANSGTICSCPSSNVSVIADTTDNVVATIGVGPGPFGLVYDSGKGEIFVGNSLDNNVSVINDITDEVVATIAVGYGPESLAYDAANGLVFVANNGDNNFTTINDSTNTVLANIFTGDISPSAIVYDSAKGEVVIANAGDGIVNVLKLSSGFSSTLTGVTVSPPSATVLPSGSSSFTADPSCTNSCSGTTFAWSVTDSALGSLNVATGSSVTFTAKGTTGQDTLFVNATLDSVTKMSAPVTVTISSTAPPPLVSVGVSPSPATVGMNGTISFATTLSCSGGSCPAGASYLWSLTDRALGSLNSTTGPTVTFTAGPNVGDLAIFINASLHGVTKESQFAITITPQSSGGGTAAGFLGLPGVEGYLLIGIIIVGVVGGVAAFRFFGRGPPRPGGPPQQYPPQYPPQYPAQLNPPPQLPPSQYPPPQYPPQPPPPSL
ncbi:MAG: YncE family protein, partial [Thermoplasmata archaeon]|nr:YncE family protein [Thermoplasmata archaeon]